MKTLRICQKGHQYYKSSDCPVCPICAEEEKPDNFLAQLSAPARRALIGAGITTIDLLTNYTVDEITNLHGIGPQALVTLEEEMTKSKLSFKTK